MHLRVNECTVTTNSITITFSAAFEPDTANTGALNPSNYTFYDPAAGFYEPTHPASATPDTSDPSGLRVVLIPSNSAVFNPGDYVLVGISNIALASDTSILMHPQSLVRQVPGKGQGGRIARDVENATSYPILTEEISYRSSPVGIPTGTGASGGGIGGLGQTAARAVSEVLGWKPNSDDPKGFVGALTQAFTLTDVEGHVESTWTPRTYAVQTDLGGGITGAQASLYMRAKNALDSALPLLDGLYPLDPEADPEYVKALREMARSQMTEIVKALGTVGLPSILRIDTYFGILLGQNPAKMVPVQFDPDEITGTLGQLRDTYGIAFAGNPFNNSVEDEQDITNFRVISDYMTSLMQSWIANRNFFMLGGNTQAFFGTQLVLISRQFTTIAETVNEVRFTLDSVFIGPNERQTLLLKFGDPALAPMFLEDVLIEVEKFAGDEGPRLLRDGGKISVTNNILPVVRTLQNMVIQAHIPRNIDELPDGFKTSRVRNSLDDLQDQLAALVSLIKQVEQKVPLPQDKLTISGIRVLRAGNAPITNAQITNAHLSIFGTGFKSGAEVFIYSSVPLSPTPIFLSAERIDVAFNPGQWNEEGSHDIMVTSPDGQSATLHDAFAIVLETDSEPSSYSVATFTPTAKAEQATGAVTRPITRKQRSVGMTTSELVQTTHHTSEQDIETMQASVAQLHQSNRDISKQLAAVMEKLSALEPAVKEKKSSNK